MLVAGLAVAGLLSEKTERLAIVATALATVILAVFTAQLYVAAFAQWVSSNRPLLIEVKPFAPSPPDIGGKPDPATGRPMYYIEYPDGSQGILWDGRRTHVSWEVGQPIRISVILRNVGTGLAIVDQEGVQATVNGAPATIDHRDVRYPRLPPVESTRINLVLGATPTATKVPLKVTVPYTDLSGTLRDEAEVIIQAKNSGAWTRDTADDRAWTITEIQYRQRT